MRRIFLLAVAMAAVSVQARALEFSEFARPKVESEAFEAPSPDDVQQAAVLRQESQTFTKGRRSVTRTTTVFSPSGHSEEAVCANGQCGASSACSSGSCGGESMMRTSRRAMRRMSRGSCGGSGCGY